MSETNGQFAEWVVLEILGHRRLVGYLQEQEIAGAGMLRIDVYEGDAETPTLTQFYSPSSVYCMTPTTEELARKAGHLGLPRPVSRYELAEAKPDEPKCHPGDYCADDEQYENDDPDDYCADDEQCENDDPEDDLKF